MNDFKCPNCGENSNLQTSIEWLVKELNQVIDYIPTNKWDAIADIIQQAKQMHKEEIIDTFFEGAYGGDNISGEQYYQETYGGQDA